MSKLCSSWLNQKNKSIRCTRLCCDNSDFCKYHKKYAIYMPGLDKLSKMSKEDDDYKILDEKYSENLLGLYDSWKDVPKKFRVILNNKYWDVRMLIDIFSNQLISCEMENPRPSYLHDPFTRRNFTPDELCIFASKCRDLSLKIYVGLAIFLKSNLKKIYKQEYATSQEMSYAIVQILSKKLRYKIINNKNSQDCYTGYWVKKSENFSDFEKLYKYYDSLPYQVYEYINHGYYIIENTEKTEIKHILDSIKQENIDLKSDDLCIYL